MKDITMTLPTINVAILGFGLSGSTFHAPLINALPGYKIYKIFARNIDKLQQQYPNYSFTSQLDDILNDRQISLIINTLPNELHYSISKQCLLAGKNVIVEKPFTVSYVEGRELIELAQERDLLLSVYHNRRWDNGYLTLQKTLPQLGKIYLYEAYFDRFRPLVQTERWKEQPKPGSGLLYDLGSHLIDQALNLFGMPTTVSADIAIQRHGAQVPDYFQLTLGYERMRVILGSSSIIANPRPILAAYGDGGCYIKHGLDPQEAQLRSGMAVTHPNYGIEEHQHSGILTIPQNSQHQQQPIISESGNYCAYYQQIYAALSSKNAIIPVSAAAGLNVIKIIELAHISNHQQKTISFT